MIQYISGMHNIQNEDNLQVLYPATISSVLLCSSFIINKFKIFHLLSPFYIQERWWTVENHRGISLLNMCYKLYRKDWNEKLKVKAEQFLMECQNGFLKRQILSDPLFSIKLLREKIRQFNLEIHFLIMWKLLRKLKDKPFEILQSKNIRND
jgi:hypothetical protein